MKIGISGRKILFALLAALNLSAIPAQSQQREDSGYLPVENVNTLPGQFAFINTKGEFIVRQLFDGAGSFSEGLAAVSFDNSWGYIDRTGRMTISPKFKEAKSFSEGLAAVRIDCKWGFIDRQGLEVIPLRFDEAYSFSSEVAVVKLKKRYGIINKARHLKLLPEEVWPWGFSEGLARFEVGSDGNRRIGFMDRNGKVVIKPLYIWAENFADGLARVAIDGWYHSQTNEWVVNKDFFIDKSGKTVDESQRKSSPGDGEELIPVRANWKSRFGYADKTGKIVINPQWKEAGKFANGLAPVRDDNGKFGYIDQSGRYVIEPQFDKAWEFREGIGLVKYLYKRGYIDRSGKFLLK